MEAYILQGRLNICEPDVTARAWINSADKALSELGFREGLMHIKLFYIFFDMG